MKTYVTLCRDQAICLEGIVFDHDCVALVTHREEKITPGEKFGLNEQLMVEIFQNGYCTRTSEEYFNMINMHQYSRGIIEVPPYTVGYSQGMLDEVIRSEEEDRLEEMRGDEGDS